MGKFPACLARASEAAMVVAAQRHEYDELNFSVTTWNINSVRLRIDLVTRFLREQQPDVLCLQEKEMSRRAVSLPRVPRAGYEHIAINGQKGYHGVATISRHAFASESRRGLCEKGDFRHLSVTLAGDAGLEIQLRSRRGR